jgi:excisionase family DNA binding protein
MPNHLLTPEEVADLLSMKVVTIRQWARQGLLPSYKIGKFRRFDREEVMAAVAQPEAARGIIAAIKER